MYSGEPGCGPPAYAAPGSASAAATSAIWSRLIPIQRRRVPPAFGRRWRLSVDGGRRGAELFVEGRRLPSDLGPVEPEDVLGRLGDEALAQVLVGQHLLHHAPERTRVAGAEAERGAAAGRDDLAQAAGVGHQADASGRHRLERDEPERLVDRRHDAQIG